MLPFILKWYSQFSFYGKTPIDDLQQIPDLIKKKLNAKTPNTTQSTFVHLHNAKIPANTPSHNEKSDQVILLSNF